MLLPWLFIQGASCYTERNTGNTIFISHPSVRNFTRIQTTYCYKKLNPTTIIRMIKLYSDDFGYNEQVDEKIVKLIKNGKLFGLSVLSNMVDRNSLVRLMRAINQPKKPLIGLHINLIEGKAVSEKREFMPLWKFFLALIVKQVDKARIKKEIHTQLSELKNNGIVVSMLDSHQHTHAFSPVAEITEEIAKKEPVPYIRYFGSVRTYSFKAKITYFLLKTMAFVSYFFAYGKIGLPATWKKDPNFDWTIMSWESNTFDVSSLENDRSVFVIHPYLGYDSNTSYIRFIK